ncbi:hypothetical protein CFC21_067895 [Triticum aestivum]|uniref:DNA-directed RNA polymerase subunit n=2 Tax=Triticum aestivum TaxID=4565 RepID=A0A9R1HA09_WHEAT|nr:DNA-directed RNA polymerase III subunit RPC8-like [Triticum aestivum]XP_044383157.1 DNA-directed RNA polymerase III subunit RPC8-like [Triticum aestivum]XP_044383158.1 DNA-directed RNA polymerase III subunit RPC8-like [Triticum aestivum]XP_044383159.1 DNA-directed RNA polymerase III subunit RPC8-like [Triticum aestivum]XP_044383160.1 DNA-directed RNA polymerase III subunit RPC8-like [Triticum aestivum]XP_044383161.1 DNA-directed RNA polymerase III subunit RPC8-like [Triticum aestivum]XP_04
MFVLSQIEHNLPMPPHLLNRPLVDAIKAELERLFLDKVVANLGLCVSVYDILSVEGGFIFPGESCSTYKVFFRLLMFRPFLGEVIVGKISGYDEEGLQEFIVAPACLVQDGVGASVGVHVHCAVRRSVNKAADAHVRRRVHHVSGSLHGDWHEFLHRAPRPRTGS